MRNRILSLLLVACMLLAAVPALLLPTTAADAAAAAEIVAETTLSKTSNMPTKQSDVFVYNGNWSVGYKTAVNNFTAYPTTPYSGDPDLIAASPWSTGNGGGGMYTDTSRGGNLLATKSGSAYRYMVPYYQAKADIVINELIFQKYVKSDAEDKATVTSANYSYFAVIVDGVIVWPKNATYEDVETWWNGAEDGDITAGVTVAENVSVGYGSSIEFVARTTASRAGEYARSIAYPNFTVRFTDGQLISQHTSSSMKADMSYKIMYGEEDKTGVDPLSYINHLYKETSVTDAATYINSTIAKLRIDYGESPWQLGTIYTAAGTKAGLFEPFVRWFPFASGTTLAKYMESANWDGQWYSTESAFQHGLSSLLNGGSPSVWNYGGTAAFNMHDSGYLGNAMPGDKSTQYATAYQYTVPHDGYLALSLNAFKGYNNLPRFCVAIDGVAIWPANAALTDVTTWFAQSTMTDAEFMAAANASLAELSAYVTEGAHVQICMACTQWLSNAGAMLDTCVEILQYADNAPAYQVLVSEASKLPALRFVAYEGAPMPGLIQGTVASINGVATTTLPDYVTEDMTIVMSEITFAGTSAFANYAPNASSPVDEDGNIIYNTTGDHQWTIGRVDTTEEYHAFAEGKTWDSFDYIDTSSKTIADIASIDQDGKIFTSLWGPAGGGMYYGDQRFAIRNLTDTDAPTIVGAQYTAGRDGLVQLGFDTLAVNRDMNPYHDTARYTVTTEDGKKYYAYYLKSDSKVLYFSETVSFSSDVYNYHYNDVTGGKLGTLYTYDAATNTVTALDETTLASMATTAFRAAFSLRKLYERLYIYQNGVQIWPENNGTFTYEADPATFANYTTSGGTDTGMKAAVGTLPTIIVNKGDTITFGLLGEDAMSNQVIMKPTVTYLAEAPAATAQVVLKERFNIDMQVYANPLAKESGVYINGVKNDYAALRDLAAKEICEEFTYATYQVINGVEIKSSTKTYTGKQVLAQHQASTNDSVVALANATIHYAEAAASYFKGDALSAEASAAIAALAAPQEASASITDTIEEQVTFQGANLLLKDTIQLKITFKKVAGAGDIAPKLQVESPAVKGMFDATLVGDTYEAVVEIPMSAYNETLAISVWSGDAQISETLTYGVGVYAYRVYQANAGNTALQNVLKTIIALGDKAIAYHP